MPEQDPTQDSIIVHIRDKLLLIGYADEVVKDTLSIVYFRAEDAVDVLYSDVVPDDSRIAYFDWFVEHWFDLDETQKDSHSDTASVLSQIIVHNWIPSKIPDYERLGHHKTIKVVDLCMQMHNVSYAARQFVCGELAVRTHESVLNTDSLALDKWVELNKLIIQVNQNPKVSISPAQLATRIMATALNPKPKGGVLRTEPIELSPEALAKLPKEFQMPETTSIPEAGDNQPSPPFEDTGKHCFYTFFEANKNNWVSLVTTQLADDEIDRLGDSTDVVCLPHNVFYTGGNDSVDVLIFNTQVGAVIIYKKPSDDTAQLVLPYGMTSPFGVRFCRLASAEMIVFVNRLFNGELFFKGPLTHATTRNTPDFSPVPDEPFKVQEPAPSTEQVAPPSAPAPELKVSMAEDEVKAPWYKTKLGIGVAAGATVVFAVVGFLAVAKFKK